MGSKPRAAAKQRLFAFWRYDTFPYLLGGEVAEFKDNGLVYVDSYRGTFRPVRVLLYTEGKALYDKLQALRAEHDRVINETNDQFVAQASALFGENVRYWEKKDDA